MRRKTLTTNFFKKREKEGKKSHRIWPKDLKNLANILTHSLFFIYKVYLNFKTTVINGIIK